MSINSILLGIIAIIIVCHVLLAVTELTFSLITVKVIVIVIVIINIDVTIQNDWRTLLLIIRILIRFGYCVSVIVIVVISWYDSITNSFWLHIWSAGWHLYRLGTLIITVVLIVIQTISIYSTQIIIVIIIVHLITLCCCHYRIVVINHAITYIIVYIYGNVSIAPEFYLTLALEKLWLWWLNVSIVTWVPFIRLPPYIIVINSIETSIVDSVLPNILKLFIFLLMLLLQLSWPLISHATKWVVHHHVHIRTMSMLSAICAVTFLIPLSALLHRWFSFYISVTAIYTKVRCFDVTDTISLRVLFLCLNIIHRQVVLTKLRWGHISLRTLCCLWPWGLFFIKSFHFLNVFYLIHIVDCNNHF